MAHIKNICTIVPFLIACLFLPAGHAQDADIQKIASWVALDAPTGHEHWAIDELQSRFNGWIKDRTGNLTKTIGTGSPHRVVVCAMDSFSYAVSQITNDGYLRLHRIASGSGHPLWDQAHQGQQLRILTRSGPLVGVTAVANGHFANLHSDETEIITEHELWLDVGAESADEVLAMGIQLLDPVTRHLPAWFFVNEVAGPRVGARVGCAAIMAAAEARINGETGRTSYVLATQQAFGWTGAAAALRNLYTETPIDELVLVGPGEAAFRNEAITQISSRFDAVTTATGVASIRYLAPKVFSPESLMERLELSEANNLLHTLIQIINPAATVPSWISAPVPAEVVNAESDRWGQTPNVDRLIAIEAQLDEVAEKSAVPGHEGPIRNVVLNALPSWARDVAQVDEMGNLLVDVGPPGEATVFIAHMDEVGWEVQSIEPDGIVTLTRLGGVVTTAWEGQPALLQLDPNTDRDSLPDAPQLRGVFLSRDNPATRQPDSVEAWFGMNAQELSAAGVTIGMGITGYKEGHRMGLYRYASRSLDDRVGTTALLHAIQQIDPEQLQQRVIFAWSVREEGGLRGAGELAKRFGMNSRRVYSIDTFVSSDTPLESPHFAYAPLGHGPVLRSVENGGLAIPYELDRNRRIAGSASIEVQIGLTQGTTDGTAFAYFGAPNAGLSWPGRYSHSPAEIADLRDVAGLIDLIQAMAMAQPDSPLND